MAQNNLAVSSLTKDQKILIVTKAITLIQTGEYEHTCLALGRAVNMVRLLHTHLFDVKGLHEIVTKAWEHWVEAQKDSDYLLWWDRYATDERQAMRIAALTKYLQHIEQTGEL